MNFAAAGRYLHIPRQTFHRWARGYERGKPLIHVRPGGDDQFPVTFIALAEAHVLDALREAGVRPQKIRPALDRLKKLFGREYVLAAVDVAAMMKAGESAETVAEEFGISIGDARTAARILLGRAA